MNANTTAARNEPNATVYSSLRDVFIASKTFQIKGLFGVVDGRDRRVVPKLLDAIGS